MGTNIRNTIGSPRIPGRGCRETIRGTLSARWAKTENSMTSHDRGQGRPSKPTSIPAPIRPGPSQAQRLQDRVVGRIDSRGDRDLTDGEVRILETVACENTDNRGGRGDVGLQEPGHGRR